MRNPWTWFKDLFRPKVAKKNEKTIRDIAKRRSVPHIPSSRLHGSRTSDVIDDITDVATTVLFVDAVTDLVGRSESIDVPPQPQVEAHEKLFSTTTVAYTESIPETTAPQFNDLSSTTFNDSSSFTFGSSAPASVDEDSLLTTVFSGIGDAVSGIGEAIGDVLSD